MGGVLREVRVPRMTLSKLKRERDAAERELRRVRGLMIEGTKVQALVHGREVGVFQIERAAYMEAIRNAVSMIDAARRGEWTPADTKRLEEIRLLAVLE
jgi:hypothetical protein